LIKLRLLLFFLIISNLFASAQKKDKWLPRNWNNMVAHYNVYYHGEKMLNEAVEDLIPLHKDDFSKPIEVYPYADEATATSLKPKMEEVMKKASTVISKKSRSKWVDDCFILIGKSHFFKGDMFLADEAFQFVNSQYSDQPIRYEAKLWILKTLVREGKVNDAEATFKSFQRDEKFPKKLQDDLNCVAGDIYTKMGLYPEAILFLEAGLKGTKNSVLKYRLNFLLAQLYLITKDYERAHAHYSKVAKSNAPYEFAFQSNVGIVKANSLSGKTVTHESRRNIKKMLKDDKNIDYYDQLYFELGNLDYADGNSTKAIKNYQSAVRKSSKNVNLKTNSYLTIANIYYENRNYRMAQKYFDSTSMFITEDHPEYEKIKLQQSVLSTLIDYLITIKTQDSLLILSEMPKDKLELEIRKIIANENEIKKKAASKKAKDEEPIPDIQPINNTAQYSSTDQFIFDNQSALGREYNDFIKRWGNRKLTDNWRISSIKKELTNEPVTSTKDTIVNKSQNSSETASNAVASPEDLKKYYIGIPFSQKDKDLAYKKILESHLEAGKIYHEKLKEHKDAIYHFEEANKRFPANQYEAEIFYFLIKCYDALSDSIQSNSVKATLLSKYPNSTYAQVLAPKDPLKKNTSNEKNENKEVLDAYERMYDAFNKGDYALVKKVKQEADSKFAGNTIQAKFDYLYALTVAKTEGVEKYKALLMDIKTNYPGTEIGDQAAYTLDLLENKDKIAKIDPNSIYKFDGNQTHYFCIVMNESETERIKTALSNFNTKYFASNGYKTKSFLLGNSDMTGVELFNDKAEAMSYYKSFVNNFKEFVPDFAASKVKYFIISTENFKTLLREMSETGYITFFEKLYF